MDSRRARLVEVASPARPTGRVLVLHGGADRPGHPPTSTTQLSVVRMIPVARRVARAGRGSLAVHRLLNSSRGWDPDRTPVEDVEWALWHLAQEGPRLPTCLVGHSLGGRAALLAGAGEDVVSVVALNPWVYADDARRVDLAGRRVLVVHGTDDRIADPGRARRVVTDLRARRTDAEMVDVEGGKHAMLRHGRVFEDHAARFAVETLVADRSG